MFFALLREIRRVIQNLGNRVASQGTAFEFKDYDAPILINAQQVSGPPMVGS